MKRKKVSSTLLTTLLACSLIVTPVFATPEEDYRAQQQEQEKKQSELEGQKAGVQSEVNDLQTQLSNLMIKMNELQYQLIEKGQEVAQAQEDLAAAEAKEQQQYEDMMLRIKYMYEEGDNSALERVASSGSIAEALSQADYVQKVHEYDREMLQEYAKTVQEVEDLKETLESEMVELEGIQAEYEVQSTELNETIESKSAEVENLDAQIQEAARLAAEASAKAEEAAAEAARKAAEEAARKAAEEEAARQQQNNNNNNTTGDNTTGNNNSDNSTTPPQTFVPDYNQSAADIIVAAAWSQVGVAMYGWVTQIPYVSFDCSGLTQWCYRQAGISIPRTDITQLNAGTIVSNPMPGDICWTPGHVAIYIGNGQMIEAQQTGVPICVSRVRATYYVRY